MRGRTFRAAPTRGAGSGSTTAEAEVASSPSVSPGVTAGVAMKGVGPGMRSAMPRSAVTREVSVEAPRSKSSPSSAISAASSRSSTVLVRLPLWAKASVPVGVGPSVGWALRQHVRAGRRVANVSQRDVGRAGPGGTARKTPWRQVPGPCRRGSACHSRWRYQHSVGLGAGEHKGRSRSGGKHPRPGPIPRRHRSDRAGDRLRRVPGRTVSCLAARREARSHSDTLFYSSWHISTLWRAHLCLHAGHSARNCARFTGEFGRLRIEMTQWSAEKTEEETWPIQR